MHCNVVVVHIMTTSSEHQPAHIHQPEGTGDDCILKYVHACLVDIDPIDVAAVSRSMRHSTVIRE